MVFKKLHSPYEATNVESGVQEARETVKLCLIKQNLSQPMDRRYVG